MDSPSAGQKAKWMDEAYRVYERHFRLDETSQIPSETHAAARDIPKSSITILNLEIGEDDAILRIRTGQRVRYVFMTADVVDFETHRLSQEIVAAMPEFPDIEWNVAGIRLGDDKQPVVRLYDAPRWGTSFRASDVLVDCLGLPKGARMHGDTYDTTFDGQSVIVKIRPWPWREGNIDRETAAYEQLLGDTKPDEKPFVPRVLGHVTEAGSVIGLILEKVPGEPAGPEDLDKCEWVLRRVHEAGVLHGDVNRNNFLVDRVTDHVRIIDFEMSVPLDPNEAEAELKSLPQTLADESGLGGTIILEGDSTPYTNRNFVPP